MNLRGGSDCRPGLPALGADKKSRGKMIAVDEPLRRAGKTGLILAGLRCALKRGAARGLVRGQGSSGQVPVGDWRLSSLAFYPSVRFFGKKNLIDTPGSSWGLTIPIELSDRKSGVQFKLYGHALGSPSCDP
jgi:hypothetical protein